MKGIFKVLKWIVLVIVIIFVIIFVVSGIRSCSNNNDNTVSKKDSLTAEKVSKPQKLVLVKGGAVADIILPDFYIGKYEITNAEWAAIMGSGVEDMNPRAYVEWFDAIEYCNRRSLQEGLTPCYSINSNGTNPDDWPSGWKESYPYNNVSCDWKALGYRLPTEKEWEYAAQGGLKTHGYTYSGSNDLDEVGWYEGNSGGTPHPVGQLTPNELGIHDMSGNLWEWCWSDDEVSRSEANRVYRGGSFDYEADFCTVSSRFDHDATRSYSNVGFRVCRISP